MCQFQLLALPLSQSQTHFFIFLSSFFLNAFIQEYIVYKVYFLYTIFLIHCRWINWLSNLGYTLELVNTNKPKNPTIAH